MTTPGNARGALHRLSDSDLELADTAQDVRGRATLDSAGEKVGKVEDLLVDEQARSVRFLEIASGGFLGMGKDRFIIPVDAVKSVDQDAVHIGRERKYLSESPSYDPKLVANEEQLQRIYSYYGYTPYWGEGYAYPMRWYV